MAIEKCSICMNYITPDHEELKCGHVFHHSCIKELFCVYMNDKCPMCRAIYTYQPTRKRKSLRRLYKRIFKKHENEYGLVSREDMGDMYYYFKQRKINIPPLKRTIGLLSKFQNREYSHVKYTKFKIFLYTNESPDQGHYIWYYITLNKDDSSFYADGSKRFIEPDILDVSDSSELEFEEFGHDDSENDESESDSDDEQMPRPEAYYRAIANRYNLNEFNVTFVHRQHPDFDIADLEQAYEGNEYITDIIHDILFHMSFQNGEDGRLYNDDIRVIAIYGITQEEITHARQLRPEFNIRDFESLPVPDDEDRIAFVLRQMRENIEEWDGYYYGYWTPGPNGDGLLPTV